MDDGYVLQQKQEEEGGWARRLALTLSSGLPPCPEEATSVSGREVGINVVFVCNYSLKKERE